MKINETLPLILSIISTCISIFTLIFTIYNSTKMKKIAYGQVEASLRNLISTAKDKYKNRIMSASEISSELKEQEIRYLKEEILNTYEEACSKYLSGKVDKKTFYQTYFEEIKSIVEQDEFKEYFQFASKYEAIKKVYCKWFQLIK